MFVEEEIHLFKERNLNRGLKTLVYRGRCNMKGMYFFDVKVRFYY